MGVGTRHPASSGSHCSSRYPSYLNAFLFFDACDVENSNLTKSTREGRESGQNSKLLIILFWNFGNPMKFWKLEKFCHYPQPAAHIHTIVALPFKGGANKVCNSLTFPHFSGFFFPALVGM